MSNELVGQGNGFFLGYQAALNDLRVKLSEVKRGNTLISYNTVDEIILDFLKKVKT